MPGTVSPIRSISPLHRLHLRLALEVGRRRIREEEQQEDRTWYQLHSVVVDALWEALLRPRGVLPVKLEVIWNIEMRNCLVENLSWGIQTDDPRIKHRVCRRSWKTEKGKVYLSSQAEKVTSKGGTPVFVLLITHCRDRDLAAGTFQWLHRCWKLKHPSRVSPHGS